MLQKLRIRSYRTAISMLALIFLFGCGESDGQDAAEQKRKRRRKSVAEIDLKSCGQDIDQNLAFVKSMENSALDMMFEVSIKEEKEIGEEVYGEITKQMTVLESDSRLPKLNQMVDELSYDVEREGLDYTVSIVRMEQVNAFATLGGYIYVTTGLLDFVESDDELAFILGHEIGHIDKEHTLRKQKKLLVAQGLGRAAGADDLAALAYNLNRMISAPFDQIDEYEADYQGYRYARAAGYDQDRFTDFFARIAKNEEKDILQKLLSTHPFPTDRKKCIEDYIRQDNN